MGSLALYQNGILCRFQEIAARENSGSVSPSRCPFYNLNFLKIWIDSPKRQPPNRSKHRLITSPKKLTQPLISHPSCPPFFVNGATTPFFHPPMVWLHLSFTLQWCGYIFLPLSNGAAALFLPLSTV